MSQVAHYEPPHQDLRCLQIQLFASLVVKELILPLSGRWFDTDGSAVWKSCKTQNNQPNLSFKN